MSPTRASIVGAGALVLLAAAVAPAAFAALGGSGNVTDYIELTTVQGSVSLLQANAASGSGDVVRSPEAFQVNNAGSNVDTLLMYSWAAAPTVGGTSTSIALRGTTHYISDLLWFRQETVSAANVATLSDNWSPLVIKDATDVKSVTYASSANLCTAWGAVPNGFTADAAGTIAVKHYAAATLNDATLPTVTVHYCVDTSANRVYLNSAASFTNAVLLEKYTTDSAGGVLKNYQHTIASNKYCLYGITGSGTAAKPELHQCSMLPYAQAASTAAKLWPLFDPPAFFPSLNQNGAVAFSVEGLQWNPYSDATQLAG